jgi:hypothetical protein
MAYNLYYTISFTNNENQIVTVKIYKNAAAPVSVGTYECTGCQVEKSSDTNDDSGFTKYGILISSTLSFGVWIPEVDTNANPITWETFITSIHTDWKVIADIDGQFYFHGWLTPDEGHALFQDKPYEVTFTATDGLRLTEQQELLKYDGTRFLTYDNDLLITFIVAALEKTKLELPIRIYCNYFHNSILNRGNALQHDMFNQLSVNRRTFLKDVNTFEDCYAVLKKIFNQFCTVEYWNGMWQITCIAEKQYLPGSQWYTDYAKDGTGETGYLVTENHAQVGKAVDIFPIRSTQYISSRYALKSAKHYFNYVIPEELVINIRMQRLGAFRAPLSGSGYSAWDVVGWTAYENEPFALTAYGGTKNYYLKTEFDSFGKELDRYYVLEMDTAAGGGAGYVLRHDNTDFRGVAGDEIEISITTRLKNTIGGTTGLGFCKLALLPYGLDGTSHGHWYSLQESGAWLNSDLAVWAQNDTSIDETLWETYTVKANKLPASGRLYVFFQMIGVDNLNETHFKDLSITYTPYIKGSRFSVKSDYWLTAQNANYPDKLEEEMFISDSPVPLIKGGFFFNNELTDGSWRRYPLTEVRHFKELPNIGRFNHSYRRMYAIDGDFNGLNYSPENDPLNKQPIGFHKRYRFVDMTPQRDFVLVPPVTMDLMKGEFKGTFVEVYKDSADGTQAGDTHEFNYTF